MDLYFLGTGAGTPSKRRNVTSIALRFFADRGCFWMFDCGEGTQHQILNSPLKLSRLEKIWITHLHGDHIYGLPGLLTSRSYQGGEGTLAVFGPPGIRAYIEHALHVSQAHLTYRLDITEIEREGLLFEDDHVTVETARLEHRIESFGFRIAEKDKPGPLLMEKLKSFDALPGPMYGRLKQGMDVVLENGKVLTAKEFVGPSIRGRVVAIMGDTRICANERRLVEDADVLVHEATFSHRLNDLAERYFHSTARDAADLALSARVSNLILTHISSRYHGESEDRLLDEARDRFPNTFLAQDLWSFPV